MKTIIVLIIIYIAYRLIKSVFLSRTIHPHGMGGGAPHEKAPEEEMVQDSVCGSYVPISSAVRYDTPEGKKYFCGTECRDKFIASLNK